MDSETNKVLHFSIVHVKQTTSSQAMEKFGFIKCVDHILEELQLKIDTISTDRHASIKKLMRTKDECKSINHQFDPWHVAKRISKKSCKPQRRKSSIVYCHNRHNQSSTIYTGLSLSAMEMVKRWSSVSLR